MQQELNVSQSYCSAVTDAAIETRHGSHLRVPEDVVRTALEHSWTIFNRYSSTEGAVINDFLSPNFLCFPDFRISLPSHQARNSTTAARRRAGYGIADVGGEKLQKAHTRPVAGGCNQRRQDGRKKATS